MSDILEVKPNSDRELAIRRLIHAPVDKVFRAWTDPKLVVQWFAPKPWTTARAEMDVRTGGSSLVIMRSPDGKEFPNPGVYLEVIPNKKIVFTDAFTTAWEPSANPFMLGELTFETQGEKTIYTARVRHWTLEAKAQHEKMGFVTGWGICTDQLEAVVQKL